MWPMCYICGMAINGTPLRIALAQAGMSQIELAAATGVERTRLSRIVNGLHCNDATRVAIAEALGRSVDELFPAAPSSEVA